MTLLEIEDLQKRFGELVVTAGVSLRLAAGERHAIIGPNGAGKTSLLNQIGGQLQPDSGRILLEGENIAGFSPEAVLKRGVARTFQRNNLFPKLSVLENVRLAIEPVRGNPFAFLSRVESRRLQRDCAGHVLQQVHLQDAASRTVSDLSYGEQRQLEIALALAGNPRLLLLDEPTSGMSPAETDRMIELIAELPPTLAILMIEHDMNVVFSVSDVVTVLYYGEVLATGRPDEIRANARVHEVYLGPAH
jgi:branched-chain amino acid transport system ATP-binding protein